MIEIELGKCKVCGNEASRRASICRNCYFSRADRKNVIICAKCNIETKKYVKLLCISCYRIDNGRKYYANPIKRNKLKKNRKKYNENKRRLVINSLGGECYCCGDKEFHRLTIDHVNNDGAEHRKKLGGDLIKMLNDIIRQNYPRDKYRVACITCNCASFWSRTKLCHDEFEKEILKKVHEEINEIKIRGIK